MARRTHDRPNAGEEPSDSASEVLRRQRLERQWWREDPDHRPGADSLWALLDKMSDGPLLLGCLDDNPEILDRAAGGTVVEVGAGHGWAACLLKRLRPEARVLASDLSGDAVASRQTFERVFDVSLDGAVATSVTDLGLADESVDLAFAVQSAHHFVDHDAALSELFRVLVPGGVVAYLHEPTCARLLYPLALRRVNRKRPHPPEDVLVRPEIESAARAAGFEVKVKLRPRLVRRGPVETVYYAALARLPLLARALPCTADFIFRRPVWSPELLQ